MILHNLFDFCLRILEVCEQLQLRSVEEISRPSVPADFKKIMDFATRPAIDFNKYVALEHLENLQNTARDTRDEKHKYYRLTFQTHVLRFTFLQNIFVL